MQSSLGQCLTEKSINGNHTFMFKVVSAAIAGNALEFYDFTVYGFFASTIAENFLPKQDKLTGISIAFLIFFIGYLARPLGALLFGQMGDRLGRKSALLVSIWLMALSTFAIGILPTYEKVGVLAPLLLLALRILQGLSCGGELTGSIIFTVEHAPKAQRGFYGSIATTGFSLGLLLGSFAGWIIHHSFSELQVTQWAWRLPFLLSVLGGFLGWLVRRATMETELFLEIHRLPNTFFDLRRDYAKQMRPAMLIMGIKIFSSVLSYLFYVFMITYMREKLHYTQQQALIINIFSLTLFILLIPWIGKLSDKIGRRPIMIVAVIGIMIWAWPYFWLLQQHSIAAGLLAQGVISLFAAAYAIFMVTIVEIVPTQMRFTVVSVAYAVEASLVSGVTPLVATLLIKITQSYVSLIAYLLVAALISLFAVYQVRETRYVPKNIDQYIKESVMKIARKMLVKGDRVEKVAAITGLPEDEVAAMKP